MYMYMSHETCHVHAMGDMYTELMCSSHWSVQHLRQSGKLTHTNLTLLCQEQEEEALRGNEGPADVARDSGWYMYMYM